MQIGVMVESFRVGVDGGLKAASELGADGVQIFATKGEMHPDNLNAKGRAALKRRIADMNLKLAALCGDFFGHGFMDEGGNAQRLDDSKKVMDLALDLGCAVVTTHIGVVPAKPSAPRYAVLARAGEQLGRYGERVGATFAIETGPEPAETLRKFLDDIGIPKGLGVNFDPANLAMVCRQKADQAVAVLGPYIVHTHAKDGRNVWPADPEVVYGVSIPKPGDRNDASYLELPLGEGDVHFETYLPALKKTGFDGFLTIEREVGDDPAKDIGLAVRFLREQLAKLA